MSTLLEKRLWRYPSTYITDYALAHLLGATVNSCQSRIKRATQAGLLMHIKRGLYCLSERCGVNPPHPFELAQFIDGPSYISLESALSFHHLIPEAVYTTTCVTTQRNKIVRTRLGRFTYQRLPTNYFFYCEVMLIEDGDYRYYVASPWKALCDYVYCNKKTEVTFSFLFDSLRIEPEELPIVSPTTLTILKNFYRNNRVDQFIQRIPKEYIRAD